jgi:hypothetical protein
MKRLLYRSVRLLALALNLVLLVVAGVEMRVSIARSVVHPLVFAETLLRHPFDGGQVLVFWAPVFALVALFWAGQR